MKTHYTQKNTEVSEYSELPIWRTANRTDLIYVGYGLAVLAFVVLSYVLGALNWLPFDPDVANYDLTLAPPFTEGHILGTDYDGRDTLTRLIIGIQAYFLPGLLSITIALSLGSLMGVLAGFRGGVTDTVVTYFSNLVDSFPRLVLILLVVAAFKPNIYYIMIVVGLTTAPLVASLVKSKIQFLKQKNFIESAVALGIPTPTIIVKHILWYNCRAVLLIQATLGMAEAVLIETSLSYLGFGVQEPTPSWGNMIKEGANHLLRGEFWSSTMPAIAILITVLGFHLLGDGLNNILEGKRER